MSRELRRRSRELFPSMPRERRAVWVRAQLIAASAQTRRFAPIGTKYMHPTTDEVPLFLARTLGPRATVTVIPDFQERVRSIGRAVARRLSR
jgi:hypothetical protein